MGELGTEKHYRLIQSAQIPWSADAEGNATKTLVDRGCGRLVLQALRMRAGGRIESPTMLAAIIVEGDAVIEGEGLGPWDFFYVDADAPAHAPVRFPSGATLLTVTMR